MSDTKPSPDDPAQSQRFIDMAKEVGAEEDLDGNFARTFDSVAKLAQQEKPRRRFRNESGTQ